jgi:predicted transglutaminase-like protease
MIKGVDHIKNGTRNAFEENIDIMDQANNLELDLELEY